MPEPAAAQPVAGLRLAVPTPWYPGALNPFAGSFVQQAVQAVRAAAPGAGGVRDVQVLHTEDWAAPRNHAMARAVWRAYRGLRTGRLREVEVAEGRLLRVPVPARAGSSFAAHAHGQATALEEVLPGGRIEADLVHAHVGVYGGWVATRLTPPGVPVLVTEHATFLDRVLDEPRAHEMYREVVDRATAVLCVSGVLRAQLVAAFPAAADKLLVVPNAVAVERMPARTVPVAALDRWLYVGRLVRHKGVLRLLEAFARCARGNPRMHLTLLGGGRLAGELAERARALGVADQVSMPGPVPHEQVVEQMHAHDLLVHLSEYETFGMTVVEAVATGMPVLVTRSGGPQETLAGLEGVAGSLVDVDEDPGEVVDAFRGLQQALADGTLDLVRARAELDARYSQAAVGRRLLELYASSTAAGTAGPPEGAP